MSVDSQVSVRRHTQHFWMLACLLVGGGLLSARPVVAVEPAPTMTLQLPEQLANYSEITWPKYFTAAQVEMFDATPDNNPLTDAGATLGRVLFYDPRLSANQSTSCASCHQQAAAFADARPVSLGFEGQSTDRNGMALTDLRFVRAGFFWDERAPSLEAAVLQPLYSHVEMGHTPETMLAAVAADDRYPPLFAAAFDSTEITEDRIARALSQFIRAMTSYRSKYDAGAEQVAAARDDFPSFTASENLGKRLFFENCQACHHLGNGEQIALFAMFRSLNNGIDVDGSVRDGGRGDITFNPSDVGLFRASSLRNVEYTAPYMHDGRLATLEDVIRHYSDEVHRHPTVGPVRPCGFYAEERTALLDFLKTLSDPQLVTDPKFSNPWQMATPATQVTAAVAHAASNAESTPRTVAERLAAGDGISEVETRAWLAALDADRDGTWTQQELAEIVPILIRTERVTVNRGRARGPRAERIRRAATGRGGPADDERPAATGTDETPAVADLDGDGNVDAIEARTYATLVRLLTIYDGGRLEVFMDRLFTSYRLTPQDIHAARKSFRTAKQQLNARWYEMDQAVLAALQATMGPEQFRRFQKLVVDGQVTRDTPRLDAAALEQAAWDRIWSIDVNDDQQLSAAEVEELTRLLSREPGGFGQRVPEGIDIRRFADRLMAFDVDANGSVEPAELPERLRHFAIDGDVDKDGHLTRGEAVPHFQRVAFKRLVETGIYIGGAFANTLQQMSYRLKDLQLEPAVRENVDAILQRHQQQMAEMSEQVVREQAELIQRLHRASAPPVTAAQR